MAGSFGYEVDHFDLSMKIGEMALFPAVREKTEAQIVVAPGVSCRAQIKDGTGQRALHPISVVERKLIS
jgi:Fe-S oxidoreductase